MKRSPIKEVMIDNPEVLCDEKCRNRLQQVYIELMIERINGVRTTIERIDE